MGGLPDAVRKRGALEGAESRRRVIRKEVGAGVFRVLFITIVCVNTNEFRAAIGGGRLRRLHRGSPLSREFVSLRIGG